MSHVCLKNRSFKNRSFKNRSFKNRSFFVLAMLLAIAMTAVVPALLMTGCSSEKSPVTITVYNWGDYIDESVLKDFEEKYGINVIYDTFATNEDMYVKIKSGSADYDVAFPSDYMIMRMIKENMLKKLNQSNIPNLRYIDAKFRQLPYDPSDEYSVPYMWGTVGIIYNKTMVDGPVDSWKVLWDNKYAKLIFMQDSQRDCIGITLKMLGYPMNTRDEAQLEEAQKALIEQKPLVLAYVVDEVKDKMIAGEAALAVVWSGDGVYMKRENTDLEYVIPKEGTNLWIDGMVIPAASKHQKEAEMFINYMCDPDIAFRNADYIGYATPHTEVLKMLEPDLVNDRSAYPTDDDLKSSEYFEYLGDFVKVYDRIWTEIKAQ